MNCNVNVITILHRFMAHMGFESVQWTGRLFMAHGRRPDGDRVVYSQKTYKDDHEDDPTFESKIDFFEEMAKFISDQGVPRLQI